MGYINSKARLKSNTRNDPRTGFVFESEVERRDAMQRTSKIIITGHCATRMRQRGYRSADLEIVERLGTPSRGGIVLRKKDIEPELNSLSAELKMVRQGRTSLQKSYPN